MEDLEPQVENIETEDEYQILQDEDQIPQDEDQISQKDPPIKQGVVEREGPKLLLIGILVLLAGLAIPLALFFLIRSPQPENHMLFFGISYYKLLFILFLSSAVMVYASLFFTRARPISILFLFCLVLFCCSPFIIGLKKDLTLSQAVFNIPFFANWPLFLNPGYVLIEVVIPLGIVAYLYLQIRKIFSRYPHNYAFLCIAIYLSITAFLGLSGLAQAGRPTIGSVFAQVFKADPDQKDMSTDFQRESPDSFYRDKMYPTQAKADKLPIPSISTTEEKERMDLQTAADFSKKLIHLSERMDGLQSQLDALEKFPLNQRADEIQDTEAIEAKVPISPSVDQETILKIKEEMKRLSAKLDAISNTFGKLALLLNIADGDPIESRSGSVVEGKSIEDQDR